MQRFSVGGGLDANHADHEAKGVSFLLLKNCLVDKRVGAVLKRPGSLTESIIGTPGIPLGMTEYIASSNGQTIPITRTLLVNFAGSFQQNQAGTWSTVSNSSYVNFATSKQCTFAKLGTKMYIAGGLPAKWGGPGTTIDRVGIVPPSLPATLNNATSSGSITLSVGTRYVLTFRDSTTGLESDWSTPSDLIGPYTSKQIVINIPTFTQQNWDKIRIYRYLDGGSFPYLVAEVAAGTTSYTDNTADASLTTRADSRYNKACPPSQAYLCCKYAQCIWYVDGSNPYKLVFSKPYTGSDVDLEYFPVNNYVISNEPITALIVVPGKMLVFHPRSISYVSGFSSDDFVFQPFIAGVGTVFAQSVATNGSEIAFLAEQGLVSVPAQGGSPRHISREIDLDLQPVLAASYNAAMYVGAAWNPALRQFVFMLGAQSTAGAPWEEVGTGKTDSATAGWQTTPGLVDDVWEDLANVNSSALLKVRIWGWSPELSSDTQNLWHEYTFPSIPNDGSDGALPLFVYHPSPSSDTGDPQQDKTFMGIWTGTQGKVLSLFRKDTNTDDGATITSEIMTGRLVPGQEDGGYKLFHALGFQNNYSDPTSDSNATLKYLLDFDDPQIRSYASSLVTITDTAVDFKKFPSMSGKHMHLYITDTSQSQSKILLGEFFIHFRERFRKDSR